MLIQILGPLAEKWNNKDMLTTVIGAYPKPSYLKITDWFNASGGTDTEYPTKSVSYTHLRAHETG